MKKTNTQVTLITGFAPASDDLKSSALLELYELI